ncbi:hypothetical protein B0T16DRAFT_393220 [Cercophora newfieldiana]|uniref:Uncharacterized protein n=1 Tax=Cercophora newfieldiana TaxID=92897 RepID=A0AA39XV53_9PEZI|nr:hypothetical protein B0T16DRAFT_393220 [Cercophora newfieldiana]
MHPHTPRKASVAVLAGLVAISGAEATANITIRANDPVTVVETVHEIVDTVTTWVQTLPTESTTGASSSRPPVTVIAADKGNTTANAIISFLNAPSCSCSPETVNQTIWSITTDFVTVVANCTADPTSPSDNRPPFMPPTPPIQINPSHGKRPTPGRPPDTPSTHADETTTVYVYPSTPSDEKPPGTSPPQATSDDRASSMSSVFTTTVFVSGTRNSTSNSDTKPSPTGAIPTTTTLPTMTSNTTTKTSSAQIPPSTFLTITTSGSVDPSVSEPSEVRVIPISGSTILSSTGNTTTVPPTITSGSQADEEVTITDAVGTKLCFYPVDSAGVTSPTGLCVVPGKDSTSNASLNVLSVPAQITKSFEAGGHLYPSGDSHISVSDDDSDSDSETTTAKRNW